MPISKPHPRKGTETHTMTASRGSYMNFKTTSPQGDGNRLRSEIDARRDTPFQNHIPARGRKLALNPLFHFFSSYFKTTSPQGDGNARAYCLSLLLALISKPHPRKGTETHSSSLPRASRGRGTAKRWKGRYERSMHLYREKASFATSAPTGLHRSPPPPFRRER